MPEELQEPGMPAALSSTAPTPPGDRAGDENGGKGDDHHKALDKVCKALRQKAAQEGVGQDKNGANQHHQLVIKPEQW
jgi:hypothetical protein